MALPSGDAAATAFPRPALGSAVQRLLPVALLALVCLAPSFAHAQSVTIDMGAGTGAP